MSTSVKVPERVGPYEIVREIGRGGMGVVYLAREPDEGTLIALKVLPETSDPTDGLERFRREAATVMKVRHPNVVPIYSVGRADGTWFIAMKYIEGCSFDALIDDRVRERTSRGDERTAIVRHPPEAPAGVQEHDGPPQEAPASRIGPPISWISPSPESRVGPPVSFLHELPFDDGAPVVRSTEPAWVTRGVAIVEKVARALDHVHAQGIVHLDVKPGNIIIDEQDEPWLVDFGLVRDLLAPVGPRTNVVVGTFQYMAPEQWGRSRDRIDRRCDLYAIGVVLYELVTLRLPFDGTDPKTIARAASKPPVPPRKINPRVTRALEKVILKAMARNPRDRYQSGAELANDLERLRTLGAPPRIRFSLRESVRRLGGRSPGLRAAVVLLALIVIGLAGLCVQGARGERRRVSDCRIEADRAFERSDYRQAAESYRLYLKLGGDDSAAVEARLKLCQDAERPAPR